MKVLIDTNIFIPAEDDGALPDRVATLFTLVHRNLYEIVVHSLSVMDLNRDKDKTRRDASLSRIRKYRHVPQCSRDKSELEAIFGRIKSDNDFVDCKILSALLDGAVDYVVSEDAGLLNRAATTGLADNCLSVRDAILILEKRDWLARSEQVFIKDLKCAELNPRDKIFDSLRRDYSGFDDWFRKCVRNERHAWVVEEAGKYAALVIINEENNDNADPGVPGSKILKLCTFKVAEFARGSRLGEAFLRKALWYATNNEFDSVYYTAYPKQVALIALSKSLGFEVVGERDNGEKTMARNMRWRARFSENLLQSSAANYPIVREFRSDGYVIPIQHHFHTKLFPEASPLASGQTPDLFADKWESDNPELFSPAVSVRKAYLSKTSVKEIPTGTPVIFYLTKNQRLKYSQRCTAFGITEQFSLATDIHSILKVARLRTVFSRTELEEMLREKGYLKVLKFLFIGYLSQPIGLTEMIDRGICKGPPQSFSSVPGQKISDLVSSVGISHRPSL